MSNCPDDEVRRYPPAAPPAGAGGPLPQGRVKPAARDRGEGQPTQVDPNQANLPPKEKAEKIPPPGVSGPDAGPAS